MRYLCKPDRLIVAALLLSLTLAACGDATYSPASTPTVPVTAWPTFTPAAEPAATPIPTETPGPAPSATSIPVTTPAGKTIVIKENDPLEGDLQIYKQVYDSSMNYDSIHFVMQTVDPDKEGKVTSSWNYTAIRTNYNKMYPFDLSLELNFLDSDYSLQVIVAGGQRYENLYNGGWVQEDYQGLAEGDMARWAREVFASYLVTTQVDTLAGWSFTLLPDETFKGQTAGHFSMSSQTEYNLEVFYNKQTYKPFRIMWQAQAESNIGTIDYEYNNPAWKIEKPAVWTLPTPSPVP